MRSQISKWIVETIKEAYMRADRDQDGRVTAYEVRALSASWAYNCQVALPDILSVAYWRSLLGVFQNSYLHYMASIADGTSTLGPVVVAQQVVDPGHLFPPPYPTRSVCSHCKDMLNEDYLVNSRYLHVRPAHHPKPRKRSLGRSRSARI